MINWDTFFWVSAGAGTAYYAYIFFKYRQRPNDYLRQIGVKPRAYTAEVTEVQQSLFSSGQTNTIPPIESVSPTIPVQGMVDELQAYLETSGKEKIEVGELKEGIRQILKKYPGISGSDIKSGINSLIAVSLENYCAVHLSADELSELWW